MRHTRFALYDITSGTFDDIVREVNAGLVPRYRSSPGFLSLGVAKVGKTAFVSQSTWETREHALEASTMVADWVKANSHEHYAIRENYVGELTIDTDTRETVGTVR